MAVINILSPHIADLIAAGEVVERPASVIKELMENAFDAGAHNVTVEIKDGGATYIRVTDDGCGMSPEDAGVAFLRHATSKLSDERGLEAIGTMGFRGEALAAISAVSEIELRTRRRGDDEGTLVTLRAGDIVDMGPVGCPTGTDMTVRSLFYNTPARLKFLKSDRSEAASCIGTALRCALGRPELSVRFLRDGKEEFFSPGDGRQDSCVYALLGRDAARDLLPCRSECEGLRVSGFVSSPSAGRGNRGAQYFFCNGRSIRSALLQSALEQAYKNTLLTGRYPACVLYLDMSCGQVDVNVHPAKTEVKFSGEKAVFDLVYHAALSALQGENRTAAPKPMADRPAPVTAAPKPRADFYQSMSAKDFREGGYAPKAPAKPAAAALRAIDVPYQTRLDTPADRAIPHASTQSPAVPKAVSLEPRKIVENPVQNVESPSVPDHKIVGEAMRTYIIVETEGELLLIDKHAAHERMIFDRLKKQERQTMSQGLISPVTLRLSGGDGELISGNAALLSELGFEIEPFGEEEFILRALPADMSAEDAGAAIEEICEKLRGCRSVDPAAARDEILHTVACKAAIKAGWDTAPEELEAVAAAVLSGAVKYCPHGRPVSVRVTRRELDKLFKRIV